MEISTASKPHQRYTIGSNSIRMRFPIPFKDLLPVETIKQLSQLVSQPTLVSAMKEAAQKLGLKEQFQSSNIQQILQQAGRWMESASEPWLRNAHPGLLPGINATGELFSSRWCTHRLCPDAIGQMSHLQSHYSETIKLDPKLRNLLIGLTSAQSVLVVPNMSQALYLISLANSAARESKSWILPRVDCVRLPQAGAMQGGNVRSILDQTKAVVYEIGTNQDCTGVDLEDAMRDKVSLMLLASPNSLPNDLRAEHRTRALAAAKVTGTSAIEILIDGSIHDLTGIGMDSKVIANAWGDSTDVIVVPGDALIGGPECGIILGKQSVMESIIKVADAVGLHANSVTKAGLLQTLECSESFEQWKQIPVGASLSTSIENLQNRADRLVVQLAACPMFEKVVAATKSCRLGAGVWGSQRLSSTVIQLYPKSLSPSAMAEQFAASEVPVWTNVQSDHIELVMRSVEPDEDRLLVQQIFPAEK